MPSGATPHVLDASLFWGPAGGVRRVLEAKHKRLPAHGFAHTVLAPGVQASEPGMVDCGGLRLPGLGGYRMVFSRRRAAQTMVALRPDLIESADPYRLPWACLDAAQQLGVPALAYCHSNLPLLLGRSVGVTAERLARRYLTRLYSRFDQVLAPSRSMVATLQHWGVERVQHQPLGVDCDVFCPERQDRALRRRLQLRLGLQKGTKLLVYVGRFAPEKNLQLLADAVQRLGPGYALLLVGSGPRPPHGERVHDLGNHHDASSVARIVASCDLFVHAGDQETFGLALLEAMACGTPLVVSAQRGLGELAEDVGCRVQGASPRRWAEAIADSCRDYPQVWRHDALERARRHDWSRVVASMAARYGHLLHAATPLRAAPGRGVPEMVSG